MSKKILAVILALMMITTSAFGLTSCSQGSEYSVTVGSVTVGAEPNSIVILSKNLADIISCMGYDIKMTGRSDAVTQKGFQVVPSVGDESAPNVEAIAEIGAEIVFAESNLDPAVKEQIEEKGITVAIFDDAQTLKQLKSMYEKIGSILGGNITGKSQGAEAAKELFDTMKEVKDAVIEEPVVKTICYVYLEDDILKTMNTGSWGSAMLNYTGATNVFKQAESNIVDNKTFLLSNPVCIFCGSEETVEYLKNSIELRELDALSENTFVVPYEDITMQGYTALEVLKTLLTNIYPEQFREQ